MGFVIPIAIIGLLDVAFAQEPNWRIFSTDNSGLSSNSVLSLALESDGTVWIGGENSINSFNGKDWTSLDINSGEIISLDVDSEDNLWVGSDNGGLHKYDGTELIEYLPERNARWISVDHSDNVWVGSFAGLSKFDGQEWTHFDSANSGIPYDISFVVHAAPDSTLWAKMSSSDTGQDHIVQYDGIDWASHSASGTTGWWQSIASDTSGNILVGKFTGLALYNQSTWISRVVPSDNLSFLGAIAVDEQNHIWCGFDGGLAKYDRTNWTFYTTSNSALPSGWVTSIVIDSNGNKWLGTYGGGLAVFNENGVVLSTSSEDEIRTPTAFLLRPNFPNPFNPSTTITYDLPEYSHLTLTIYDVTGGQVVTLQDDEQPAGHYEIRWDGRDQSGQRVSSGMYFARLQSEELVRTVKMVFLK